jgi:DNA-binding transcriptional MerR regulator
VTDRSYLSIGDVLALLRDEFPDITISKIRFLESRGLLDPERTPSGYRKFYEADVERLRWILRQQRENFLPLKIIKGRLEGGPDQADEAPSLFDAADLPAPQPAEDRALVGVLSMARVPAGGRARRGSDWPAAPSGAGAEPDVPAAPVTEVSRSWATGRSDQSWPGASADLGDREEPMARRQAGARARAEEPDPARKDAVVTELDVRSEHASRPATGGARQGTVTDEPAAPAGPGGDADAAGQDETATSPEAERKGGKSGGDKPRRSGKGGALAPARGNHEPEGPAAAAGARSPLRPRQRRPKSLEQGASMTTAELADASGLEVPDVERLEEFGLVTGRVVAGVRCFDEDALIVARIAAGFARFGVEPRHLRTFKHAADREAGLFEQVVIPLLRQRNPEARAKANESLDELTHLGAALQAALVGAALKDVTG